MYSAVRALAAAAAPATAAASAAWLVGTTVSADSEVFSWGSNQYGQLGLGHEKDIFKPTKIDALSKHTIFNVTSGAASSATATISEDGSVFTFGCGKHNMLGHGDGGDAPNQDSPRWVSGLPADCRVASIAVGGMHMLALDTTGTVWSWGAQGRASPVGRAGAASPGVPGKVGGALQGKDIVQVAAGRRHSVALTREGELYTWGGGHYGALGHGSRKDCPEPTLVQGFRSPVIHVSAGSDHTVVLLADGKVFAFGSDEYGQCGVGFKNRAEREPVQVSGFDGKPIVKVIAGEYHSLALANDGTVFAWGANKDGQLGTGDRTNAGTPRSVDGLLGLKVVDAAAGGHTVFLTDDNRVFVTGRGREGQLGRGDSLESVAAARLDPVEVHAISAAATAAGMAGSPKVVGVAAGKLHSAALVSNE